MLKSPCVSGAGLLVPSPVVAWGIELAKAQNTENARAADLGYVTWCCAHVADFRRN